MNIGKSILVACAKKEISRKELASNTNISEQTISALVRGKSKCKQSTLEEFSGFFGMPVSEFIALGE